MPLASEMSFCHESLGQVFMKISKLTDFFSRIHKLFIVPPPPPQVIEESVIPFFSNSIEFVLQLEITIFQKKKKLFEI